jgi:ABC-type dipeptide/oligopeptide/nickel transport system permease component
LTRFIVRRLLILLPLLFAVSIVVFALGKSLPGDPVAAFLNSVGVDNPKLVAAMRAKYRLDDPLLVQYWTWLTLALQGDLGESIRRGEPVTTLLFRGMRNTASIATASVVLVIVVGWTSGVLAAVVHRWNKVPALDRLAAQLPVLMLSVPGFSVAVFMVLLFGVTLGWLPTGGISGARAGGDIADLARHMILPTIALALASVGANWRLARNTMIEVLHEDYIRTAHAKGLPFWRVLFVHALRNVVIPLITSAGLLFGSLLTGSFILEFIFNWPGIGKLMVESALFRDIPVVMGGTMLLAIIYLLINLVVDVLYAVIDPRVRYG